MRTKEDKSRPSDNWNTPPEILERVRKVNTIALDPCSNKNSMVKASVTADDEGLDLDWSAFIEEGLVFVNPPFSELKIWAEKISEEAPHREIIAIVPANVSHSAWEYLWQNDPLVCFPAKRVRYWLNGKVGPQPPFGSAILYWGPQRRKFSTAFEDLGPIVWRAK